MCLFRSVLPWNVRPQMGQTLSALIKLLVVLLSCELPLIEATLVLSSGAELLRDEADFMRDEEGEEPPMAANHADGGDDGKISARDANT